MIRLVSIRIRNFRGIRELDLDFDGKNFAIQGPNGSGKSGVVDAIEFALTGAITRLTGPGTGGLSTTRHGPHVDYRDMPRESSVSLTALLTHTGTTATIQRTLDQPKVARISPDDVATRGIFERLSTHPEFVLSRREIIKYILVEAGKRAAEIQSLLKLERIEQFRSALRTASNSLARSRATAEVAKRTAREALRTCLSLATLSKESVLAEANKQRIIAGLELLEDIAPSIRLDAGARSDDTQQKRKVLSKRVVLADISTLRGLYGPAQPKAITTELAECSTKLVELRADPSLIEDLEKGEFLAFGLQYFDGRTCPLCDTDWQEDALRKLIGEKMARVNRGRALGTRLVALSNKITAHIQNLERPFSALAAAAEAANLPSEESVFTAATELLASVRTGLGSTTKMLALAPSSLSIIVSLGAEELSALATLQAAVEVLPGVPSPGEARAVLIEAQIRLEEVRAADRRVEQTRKADEKAKLALSKYDEIVESFLNRLYEEVEGRFTSHYQLVNPDDESAFRAQIQHAAGSVDLDVDFYGRGLFPPVAYHSEGHQDGMGLCLYLALMQQVLGGAFSFAVLDDVVMSVDAAHRREVCKLLKERFAGTQFIITTHDRVWLGQMKTAGLIGGKAAKQFTQWSIDHGPFVSEAKEAWEKIQEKLNSDDVPEAAGILRRYLESLGHDLGDRLGIEVPLRQDAAYDLGELLPRVVARWNTLLGIAASSAQSWANGEAQRVVAERKAAFSAAKQACSIEQWAINPLVHYNEWANFSKQDFQPVVDAYKALVACFRCQSCRAWFYLEPPRRNAETIRCDCGRDPLNLVPKPKS
jgi:hypothetical protein